MSLCPCMIIRNSVCQSRFKIINFGRNVEVTNSLIFFIRHQPVVPDILAPNVPCVPADTRTSAPEKERLESVSEIPLLVAICPVQG